MTEKVPAYDVIVDFWQWYQRRKERRHGPLASHALDKCEEMFARREWAGFGYWHQIFVRERVAREHKHKRM